jgi:Tol biopolymer transport system component
MSSDRAVYRLSLDGRAALVGGAPSSSTPITKLSPKGRYRVEVSAAGVMLIDGRTRARRLLTSSLYAQTPYWSAAGTLAFVDRKSGLTHLVVFDPATRVRRVVASHVCGDALVDPWAPDGKSLAVAVSRPQTGCNGRGGTVVAVSDATRGRMRRITTPQTTPIAWSGDGSRLLIADRGADASRLVDVRTGKGAFVFPAYGPLESGSWSNGRRYYAALAQDLARSEQTLVIADGAFRRIVKKLGYANLHTWAPRQQRLAVANQTSVRVLDAATGRTVATIPAQTPNGIVVQALAWDHNERSLTIVASPSLGHD